MKFVILLTILISLLAGYGFLRAQTNVSLPPVSSHVANLPPLILSSTNQFRSAPLSLAPAFSLLSLTPAFPLNSNTNSKTENEKDLQSLKPGIYRTRPYSCIIIVPKPTHDDNLVHSPVNTNSPMRIINPDSQFALTRPNAKLK